MPRAFSAQERAHIEDKLEQAARELLPSLGLKATTVAALARAAGISKGAFYSFFDSKEALFLHALLKDEAAAREEAIAALGAPGPDGRARLVAWLGCLFTSLERYPMLQVMTQPQELDLLLRALPPELLAENLRDDDAFFLSLLQPWADAGWLEGVDLLAAARLPRVAFAMHAQRGLIGEEAMGPLTALLIGSLADRFAARSGPGAAQVDGAAQVGGAP